MVSGWLCHLLRCLSLAALLAVGLRAPLAIAADAADHEIERLLSLPTAQRQLSLQSLEALLTRSHPDAHPKILLAIGSLRLEEGKDKTQTLAVLARLEGLTGAEARVAQGVMQAALQSQAEDAKRILSKAQRELTPAVGDLVRIRLLTSLAQAEEQIGNIEESIGLRLRAIETAYHMGNARRSAEIRTKLAWTYGTLNQWTQARDINARALRQARSLNNDDLLASVLNTQAFIDGASGDLATSMRSMDEAITLTERSGDLAFLALLLANAADTSLKNSDFKQALQLADRALSLGLATNDKPSVSVARFNRAIAKIMLKQVEAGKADLREAFSQEEPQGQALDKADQLQEAAGYLERAGDLKGALQLYLEHRTLADRLFKESQQRAILELQAAFDRDERERDMRLLQEEAALQSARLEAKQLQERTWLAIACATVLSTGLLAWLWRHTRHANRQMAQVNARLLMQSERDPLTGLANRRRMAQVLTECRTDGRWHGCLMLVDLDHFKRINDDKGHAVGDAVLVEVGRRLTAAVREDDLVARWGGEEFLIAARDTTEVDAAHLVQRVLNSVCQSPVVQAQEQIPISASVGYACFPMGPSALTLPWEHAIGLVDMALYLAKAHGRNRAYGIHSSEISREEDLMAASSSLQEAWRRGHIHLHLVQGCSEPLSHGAPP